MSLSQDRFLEKLYGYEWGRSLLKIMISPTFSKIGGWCLDTKISALAIPYFVKKNGIDLTDCEKKTFRSFNDFFKRKLVKEARPVCAEKKYWISPCDARLSVYDIEEDNRFLIKGTEYTIAELLKNEGLAKHYEGGKLWLYRLCVDDYHRYIYPMNGWKTKNYKIPGFFHTVNPIANEHYPIYKENTREFCLLKTSYCGTLVMMEVGAMLVGKIENQHPAEKFVRRGDEKGNFAFGGSTIIVLTQKDKVVPRQDLYEQLNTGKEIKVKMGEKVGTLTYENKRW